MHASDDMNNPQNAEDANFSAFFTKLTAVVEKIQTKKSQ